MKKIFKKATALVLCLALVFTLAAQSFATEKEQSQEYVPSILIHGIAQMDTFLWNDDGSPVIGEDGTQATGWPITVDVKELVLTIIFPFLLTLITQQDFASEAGYKAICNALKYNASNPDGSPVYNTTVNRVYCSVAEMEPEDRQHVYDAIPINDYAETVGEENVYFFAYNSTGNVVDEAEALNDYIEMVKEQRNVDKVNLVPVSMGGTIVTAWLEMYSGKYDLYYENYHSINKIVFVVAALDGSNILGELATGNTLLTKPEYLYQTLIPKLLGETWTSYLLNLVLRILPEDVVQNILASIVQGAIDTLLGNNTLFWALMPTAYFDESFENYFKDKGPEYDVIKNEIKFYNTSQKNLQSNLNTITGEKYNTIVHAICSYDVELYPIGITSLTVSSDSIIHSTSTGLNATFANLGETLPVNYTAKNPICTDKTHNHISPDKKVDASTSYLPENTWFIQGLNHERTGSSDSVIKFVSVLLIDDKIKDVHSDPENYPQFNGSRVTKRLVNSYIPDAEKLLEGNTLTAEQRAELENALTACKDMLKETVIDTQKSQARIDALYLAIAKTGLYSMPEEETEAEKVLLKIFKSLSEMAYKAQFGE